MSYAEPPPSVGALRNAQSNQSSVVLASDNSIPIEITAFCNIGWQIETRYDQKYPALRRQSYTGVQPSLQTTTITIQESPTAIQLTADDSTISFTKSTAAFTITQSGAVFTSTPSPFHLHPEPTQIYERLMSRKVTDFSYRAPFAPKGELFTTHMVRFQYELSPGMVLGLPGQSGELNRHGYRFELYNTDTYLHLPSREPLYQSWPILFHQTADKQHWIGVFHDNPSRTFVDIGDFYENRVTFESITGNTRVTIMLGTSLEDVAHKCSLLLGKPVFPPLWSFGYQQCRFSYMTTTELRTVLQKFNQENVPLDAIYCDIDSFDNFRVFTAHAKTHADLPAFIAEAKTQGVHPVSIVDPGIKIDDSYEAYQRLKASGGYLKNSDGSDFIAKVWPGDCLLPDFTDPKTKTLWADLEAQWLTKYPFDGIWNDMNEPSNFDGMTQKTSRTITHDGPLAHVYNTYGYHMSIASKSGWEQYAPSKRPLIISRSGYPGLQQHAVIWHGDNHAWWEHLRLAFHTALLYALCGAYYTGADVPGFTGNPSDDLAIRFFQLGAFLPFYRGHSIYFAKDKEPYAFSPTTRQYIYSAITLRYSLLREWYSGFHQAISSQQTPMLPTFDTKNMLIRDQMLLFNKFLVAPIFERDQIKRLLYLPPGKWYALGHPDKPLQGNQWMTIDVDLTTIPIYVKGGSIVVRNTVGKNTAETFSKPESYEIYPDEQNEAKGYYYHDDGVSTNDLKQQRYTLVANKNNTVEKTTL